MVNNNLIDELEILETQKKEITKKELELKEKIVELAKENGEEVLYGTNKKCSIKEYERIIYPEDKTIIIKALKEKDLWDEFSMINYSHFTSRIKKKEMNEDLVNLIKKEKAFRVTLSKIINDD